MKRFEATDIIEAFRYMQKGQHVGKIVGHVGQTNYSAANAYLAAFAQFRHEQGLPAGVLNIGVVDDVGYVVENPALLEQFRALSFYTL